MKVESGRKPGEQFISLLAVELVDVMGQSQVALTKRTDCRPNIILMAGIELYLSISLHINLIDQDNTVSYI